MNRPLPGWLVPAAAVAVLALLAVDVARALDTGIADAGLAFFAPTACIGVAAALAVGRWPERRKMAALILLWLLVGVVGDLDWDWPASRTAATLAVLAFGLQPAVYTHMVFAYPAGRVRDRLERAFVALVYVVVLLWIGFPLLFASQQDCTGDCLPRVPSLLFTGVTFDLAPVGRAFAMLFVALGLAFLAVAARRVRATPPGAWRTLLPIAAAGAFAAAEFVAARIAFLGGWRQLSGPLDWADRANTLIVPLAIFVGIATIRRQRGPVGDLIVEVGSIEPSEIRAALARTVGDPSLELGLWISDEQKFVDEHGVELELPETGSGRAWTPIGSANEPLAALVHDERLLGQRPLLEAAGSAARLALENARLQTELRVQIRELRASRMRIVTAADAERRRLERDLHDGAQQRLLAVGLALQLLRDNHGDPQLLTEAEAELQAALHELRDLARGIHPSILNDQGLGPAIRSLVDRAPLPISAEVSDERYGQSIEAAAYFVVSEALANVAKHAHARSAQISVSRLNGHLVVEVCDDGRGGAAAASGSGLQGLSDRVRALEGRLTIESARGAGTTLRAEIPCVSS
ncbi:MAG: sensor histidine kinase [Gaiellaceae bacterium]